MKYYMMSDNEKRLLERVKDKLYSPKVKTGDEIRDMAHQVLHILEHLEEVDLDELLKAGKD